MITLLKACQSLATPHLLSYSTGIVNGMVTVLAKQRVEPRGQLLGDTATLQTRSSNLLPSYVEHIQLSGPGAATKLRLDR
jgi:hypothetical protein